MARLFPNKLGGSSSPHVAKVLLPLRRIPGDGVMVWIRLPLFEEWRPDLMVIYRGCHLIAASNLTETRAKMTLRGDLFAAAEGISAPADVVQTERNRLRRFREQVLEEAGMAYGGMGLPIRLVVAFPDVPQALLDEIARCGEVRDCAFWGKESLSEEHLTREIQSSPGAALGADLVDCLRRKFTPEIEIPATIVPRVRETGASLTGYLLDLDQEWLAKDDLALSEEAGNVAEDLRLRLVTGVAGSGKTLILLYRAMFHARLRPQARILILTHNRPLNGEMRDRFRRIHPGGSLRWQTFFQWCREISGRHWLDIVTLRERHELLRNRTGRSPILSRLPLEFLADELDWVRDHGIVSLEDYLAVVRNGRKRPLGDEQRQAVFSFLKDYEAALAARGKNDWSGAALKTWQLMQEGQIPTPVHDLVLLDEAQFFAPVWLRLVRSGIRPRGGQLFIAADPTQGFLKRRQSWLSSGLNVRGNSVRLSRAYRNSRDILLFAARFYLSRLSADDEELNLPQPGDLDALPRGEKPQLIAIDSPQSERTRVANEIVKAIREGALPEHFLVIHADAACVAPLIQTIDRVAGQSLARDLKNLNYATREKVRVCSLNAATGLESPVVFLCGLDELLEKEGTLGLHSDDRFEIVRDNTRRIYMGITRASQKLLITCRHRSTLAAFQAVPSPADLAPALAKAGDELSAHAG